MTLCRDDVQAAIVRNYKGLGIEIGEDTERHLRVEKKNNIRDIGEEVVDGLVDEVVGGGLGAVTAFCTNLAAAQRVGVWERMYEVPVFDTVTTMVWDMLKQCGVDVMKLEG